MITLKTNLGSFDVPNSYSDITIKDFQFMQEHADDQFKVAERLTGLSIAELSLMDFESIFVHFEFISESVIETIDPHNTIEIEGKIYTLPERISSKAWNQKIFATKAILNNDHLGILSSYLQPIIDGDKLNLERRKEVENDLLELSVFDVYSCVNFITKQLTDLLVRDSEMLKADIDPNHVRAGVSMFNVLGDSNLIDMVAGGNALNYEAVELLPYDVIFIKLLKSNIQSKFEKNLSVILKENKPQ